MNPQRLLAIGSMIIILAGLIHGSVIGGFLLPEFREGALNLEKEALEELGRDNPDAATGKWEESDKLHRIRNFHRSSHSHSMLMGLTALVFAPYLSKTPFGRKTRYLLAAAILLGAALLPAGVLYEVWSEDTGSMLAALAGGAIFLLALIVLFVGYLINLKAESED